MANSAFPFYSTDGSLGVNVAVVDSAIPAFALGQTVAGNSGTSWIYVQANTAITKHDACVISASFVAAPITTANAANGWQIGVANGVALAAGNYGWLNRGGSGTYVKVNAAAACAPGVLLHTSTVAGILDDSSSDQVAIQGIVITSTVGATAAATGAIISFPRTTEA
jgi:hypothetical protein